MTHVYACLMFTCYQYQGEVFTSFQSSVAITQCPVMKVDISLDSDYLFQYTTTFAHNKASIGQALSNYWASSRLILVLVLLSIGQILGKY